MNAKAGKMFGVRVLIVGAANGIGEAAARTCVRHEARVVGIDTAATDIEVRFKSVPGVSGIAMSLEEPQAVVDAAVAKLGGLDVVVLSNELQPKRPISDAPMQAEHTRSLLARIKAYYEAAQPSLEKSPGGRFVAIGMLRSAFSRDGQILRENTEHSLATLIRQLAAGSGGLGVTVNYVQPGAIMTPESRAVFKADKALRDFCIQHCAARRLGEALDVAKAVLFLVSDDAAFVSGTGIYVDGGRAS